jgi:pyridoxine 4-dehydrogenase
VCVQNLLHLADSSVTQVLKECIEHDIVFVSFCPLGWPHSEANPVLNQSGSDPDGPPPRHPPAAGRTAAAGTHVLLIPGTASRDHLMENLAAEDVQLMANPCAY